MPFDEDEEDDDFDGSDFDEDDLFEPNDDGFLDPLDDDLED